MRIPALALFTLSACTVPLPTPPPVIGGGGGHTIIGGGGGGGTGGGVFVSHDGGGIGSCSAASEQGVAESGVTPRAISGGTMAALRDGSFAIGDPDRAKLWLISADFTIVRSVALSVDDEPGRVIEGSPGFVYVSLRRSSGIAEINVTDGTMRRLPTCSQPRGLAYQSSNSTLVVACLGGELESLDPTTGVRATLPGSRVLSDLRDVVIDGDRLVVTQLRSGSISAISSSGVVTSIITPDVAGFLPHVAWRAVARQGGGVSLLRQQHKTTNINTTSCQGYGGFARTDTRSSGGGSGTGGSGGFGSIVQSELLTVTNTTTVRTPLSESFNSVVLPVDLAISNAGRIGIVSAGTGTVALLEPGLRRDFNVVTRGVDTQITSAVFVGERLFVFSRQPAELLEVDSNGGVSSRSKLVAADSIATGHELFHRATQVNLACASCHPEAGEDGHTWNLTEGLRRTPSLRGGIGGTAPFHWSGDMENINALMANVMGMRMFGPALTLEGAQSVEDWLHTVPALQAPKIDVDAAARGQLVFRGNAGCVACHAGEQGTNNLTLDVGTGSAMQVPRLVEFAWRAPWFHDGRMKTPGERFADSSGGDSHGAVSTLSAADKADLLEYLSTR